MITESIISNYQQQFRSMFDALGASPTFKNWTEVYRQLVFWELEMEKSDTAEMFDVLLDQKEANAAFLNLSPGIMQHGSIIPMKMPRY